MRPVAARSAPAIVERESSSEKERAEERAKEYALKAAFLPHFFKYTTWPKVKVKEGEDPAPFRLVVLGEDPFGEVLDKTFKGREIQGRSVTIVRQAELDEDFNADMVFASGLDDEEREALLEACRGAPTLIVGEEPGFAKAGAHCNFYLEESHVRFEINTDAVKESKLTISSELLKLARLIKKKKKEDSQE